VAVVINEHFDPVVHEDGDDASAEGTSEVGHYRKAVTRSQGGWGNDGYTKSCSFRAKVLRSSECWSENSNGSSKDGLDMHRDEY